MIDRAARSRALPLCWPPCTAVAGPAGHESRAGQGMRRHGQPQALSVRAQQNGPLDLKLTARGRRAYLAVPNEQAIMPSQKLRQAHCREGVEALPPRRSAAGAAGRPPERSRGAAPRGLIYMLSPHHSKLAHVPSVRRPDFITPGLHANRRLQARWPDLVWTSFAVTQGGVCARQERAEITI